MEVGLLVAKFNKSINYWINALDGYSLAQLCQQPSAQSWSLGQLYLHLINDTQFFIDQIRQCHNNEHAAKEPVDFAKALFINDTFPEIKIDGNPNNAFIPQPESKEQLKARLLAIKDEMNALAEKMNLSFKGKSQHPGLGYFTAAEWIHFADIHFRHHIKQQERIDAFIFSCNSND